jgi:hypothetical protein
MSSMDADEHGRRDTKYHNLFIFNAITEFLLILPFRLSRMNLVFSSQARSKGSCFQKYGTPAKRGPDRSPGHPLAAGRLAVYHENSIPQQIGGPAVMH